MAYEIFSVDEDGNKVNRAGVADDEQEAVDDIQRLREMLERVNLPKVADFKAFER